ncbi:MAG: M12 family metallo-peptidase, partial [Gammaproteobacteria bacterium]
CGTGDLHPTGDQAFATIVSELQTAFASAPGATSEITVGMVGDFEFSDSFGANATAAIMTRLNNIDGIFSDQLGIQIAVPTIEIFTDIDDPFSDETEASDLLRELRFYRDATAAQNAHGLTHMYTGKNLNDTTVGIAFLGALCSNQFGVGLSEARRGATTDSLIAAHEIGHNFGAPHDGESGSACESTTGIFLMSPSVTGVDQFSQCSIDEMQPEIASANGQCLFPLSNVDVAVSANPANLTTALGSNFDVTFIVDNSGGGDTANNVNVSAQVGTEFSLQSATPSAGSCTSGAGSVDCQLGSIPSGAGRNVVLNLSANIIGTTNLSASITADQDNNSSNNTASAQITITPSVDMTVAAAAATQVTVNQSASLQIQVDNLSSGTATNVAVTITLDAGLRVDSVDWSVGNCSVVNQQVDCQSSSLLGPATATIQLDVTGISQGQQSYSASVTADQPDPSNGNNSATGTVTVNAQQAAGGDGGSTGPVNPGLLVALFGLAALRRRSTPH